MNGYKFTRLTVSGTTITPGTETTITAPSPNDNINRIYGIIPFDTTYSVLIIQSGNSVSSFRFQLLKRTASNTFSIIAQNVPTQEYMLPAITGNYNNHSWCKFGTNRFAFVAIRTDGNFGDGIMRMLNFYVDTTNEKIIQKGFWDPNLAFGTTNNSYNYPLLKNITNGPSFMLFYSDQITNTNCYIIDMYGSNGDNNWSCVKLLSSDKDLYHLRNGVATTDTNAGSSATIKLFENY
jgi:hypothetical protein